MKKVKLAVVTGIVSLAVAVGALVAAPSASAMPISCDQAYRLALYYEDLADIALNVFHDEWRSAFYRGRAYGIIQGCV
jgi:hypothetical protein